MVAPFESAFESGFKVEDSLFPLSWPQLRWAEVVLMIERRRGTKNILRAIGLFCFPASVLNAFRCMATCVNAPTICCALKG